VINATAIAWLDGEITRRGNAGELAERFKRYQRQAHDDFAMYAWLEQQGKLPPAGEGIKPRHIKQWREAQAQVNR
jgi:hypothetical protein